MPSQIPLNFLHDNIEYTGYLQPLQNAPLCNYYRIILNYRYEGDMVFYWEWTCHPHEEWTGFLESVIASAVDSGTV